MRTAHLIILSVCSMTVMSLGDFADAQSSDPQELVVQIAAQLKQSSVNEAKITELCTAIRAADYMPIGDFAYVVSLLAQRKQLKQAQAIVDSTYVLLKTRYGKPGENPNESTDLDGFAAAFSKYGYESEADQVYVNWAKTNEKSFGLRSPKTAAAWLQAADYFAKGKKFDSSRICLKQAYRILNSLPATDAVEAIGDLVNIADLYQDGSNFADAEDILRFEIGIEHQIRSPKERKDTVFCLTEAGTQQRLADLYVEQKRFADARRIILAVVDCLVKNLPASKQAYADDVRRLVGQLGVSYRLGTIEQVLNAMVTTDYYGFRYSPTTECVTIDQPKVFIRSSGSPLLDFRMALTESGGQPPSNMLDTMTEEAIANAASSLGDREMENHYMEQIIALEQDRLNKFPSPGPNFLVAAYKDYALRLENQGLTDPAANVRAEADRFAKEWPTRPRNIHH